MREYKKWSYKELDNLKKYYPYKSKEFLIKEFNRNWKAISKKANVLGIKKNIKSDISVLLDDNPISYYWMGFIAADGHLADRRLQVKISKEDKEHLFKLKTFLKSDNKIYERKGSNSISLSCGSKDLVNKIKLKFDLTNRKTYNPPDIKSLKMEDDLLFSFIIGYIDGDGWIGINNKKYYQISVSSHNSWKENFQFIVNFIYDFFNENNKINIIEYKTFDNPSDKKKECHKVKFTLNKTSLIKNMKIKINSLSLPTLDRKWNKIKN